MAQSRKVYEAHLGFYDTVVAAFSQKSALAAWGSSSDLFQMGIARITDDPAKIKAALSKPGLVLRRPAGTNIAFSENPPLPKLDAKQKRKSP
jgi:colicin import membrane protein